MSRWMKHVDDLCDKETKLFDIEIEVEEEVDDGDIGPDLLGREITAAIKELKDSKASGTNDIPADFLKSLVGDAKEELKLLCHMTYTNEDWPEDHRKISMIAFFKKPNTIKCS
ncbi:uncharacterized protein [Palaemon carinicauda]|uniref:uncharacterized protein n=1 Tax=Palaemon carinicauda TaxID=392227 RepID=UPI0035B57FCE